MGHGNGIVQTMNGERESNINAIIRPRQRHTCNEHRRKKLTGNCIKAVDSKEGTLIIYKQCIQKEESCLQICCECRQRNIAYIQTVHPEEETLLLSKE